MLFLFLFLLSISIAIDNGFYSLPITHQDPLSIKLENKTVVLLLDEFDPKTLRLESTDNKNKKRIINLKNSLRSFFFSESQLDITLLSNETETQTNLQSQPSDSNYPIHTNSTHKKPTNSKENSKSRDSKNQKKKHFINFWIIPFGVCGSVLYSLSTKYEMGFEFHFQNAPANFCFFPMEHSALEDQNNLLQSSLPSGSEKVETESHIQSTDEASEDEGNNSDKASNQREDKTPDNPIPSNLQKKSTRRATTSIQNKITPSFSISTAIKMLSSKSSSTIDFISSNYKKIKGCKGKNLRCDLSTTDPFFIKFHHHNPGSGFSAYFKYIVSHNNRKTRESVECELEPIAQFANWSIEEPKTEFEVENTYCKIDHFEIWVHFLLILINIVLFGGLLLIFLNSCGFINCKSILGFPKYAFTFRKIRHPIDHFEPSEIPAAFEINADL